MTMAMLVLLLLCCVAAAAASSSTTITSKGCNSYPCMIFEDNFDTLDMDKWEHEITAGGGGNSEFQYYHSSRRNSFTRDGKLFIKPTLTENVHDENYVRYGTLDLWGASPANLCTGNAWGGCYRVAGGGRILPPLQSARIRTVKSFNFRYGRIEVEAKLPTGDWIWPAIWLLSKHDEYGPWPASGEIDLMEARGNRQLTTQDGVDVGIQEVGMTMHWGPRWPYNAWPKTHGTKRLTNGKTFGDDFYKYQLEWGPDKGLVFSINGEHIMTANPPEGFWKLGDFRDPNGNPLQDSMNPWQPSIGATRLAPFDKPFHLIMNVAVGGTNYFADSFINKPYPKPWRNDDPFAMTNFYNAKNLWLPTWRDDNDETAMQVNYVRVWKMQPDP